MKQLKLVYQVNAFENDMIDYREILLQNALLGMQELINIRDKIENSRPMSDENRKHSRTIEQVFSIICNFGKPFCRKIPKRIWNL